MTTTRSLALASALLMMLSACGKDEAASGPGGPGGGDMPPPEVGVIQARAGDVPLRQEAVGRLSAYRSADVRARVPGVLQKRVYDEGTDVKQGQVLFVIDPAQLKAALGQAKAAQAQAQATYANAKAAANRARQLLPQKYISQSDYDDALAAERSAAASVQQSSAAVDSAQLDLGYATVRAPIAGRAGKQQVTEGALVGQGAATLLTTVDQIDPLYANFSLSVGELAQIRRMQAEGDDRGQVEVLLPDGTPYGRPGELDFSGDSVDPATGAVSLRAVIPNPDRVLLPGTYVTLKTVLGEVPNAFLIPQQAVQRDAKGAFVLVVGDDGKVARKDVKAERSQGDQWIVTGGLSGGERVIVSGLQKAKPEQPAKAVPWQPEQAGDAAEQRGQPGQGGKPGAPAAGAKPASGDASRQKDAGTSGRG